VLISLVGGYRLEGVPAERRGDKDRGALGKFGRDIKEWWHPDGFDGKPGKYELEWSGPAASACLNARHPRVHVYASSSEYTQIGEFILFVCGFLAGTGFS